jgi:hypothetical protein
MVPETFALGIAVFEGGDRYHVEARLRYRIADGGKMTMWYDLLRPHKVLEDALSFVWKAIEAELGMQVLNGGNACLIGNEILQFRTATLQSDGSYTLSGLLRGRKGTQTTGHTMGDRFVLLSQSALVRPAAEDAEIGLIRSYKATTIGSSIAAVSTQEFTNTGIARRPYSPVQTGGGRNATGDLTINWIRRSRINAEWRDYVDAGLGETTESYEIEVLNTSVSPAVVVRTLTATTNTVQYTAAQQTTDFSSPLPAAVTVRIYQISSTYGRGLPAEAVI